MKLAKFTIQPDTSFSLAAAAAFGFGPRTGRPKPAANQMSLAFAADDMYHHAGAHVLQEPDGAITVTVDTEADPEAVLWQVRRILSLDQDGARWAEVGTRDPVIGALQREQDWLRPVLFHSPYEAAAWSIISARRYRGQAAVIRDRISAEIGRTYTLAGEEIRAFPLPHRLLKTDTLPGVAPNRVQWLHAVARAALDGVLEPRRLASMEPADALAELQELPGIGPMYATLILLRSTGVSDVLTLTEPRLPGYVAHFYGTGAAPVSREELSRIAEGWRPFRTWAAVLIRAAGDRQGLPAAA
jgi:DNA-3-methyladenine glycosylase II